MIKTAMIDNGVGTHTSIPRRLVIANKHVLDDATFSSEGTNHGDWCAEVFTAVSGASFDFSIRLPTDNGGCLNTEDFLTAVNWCYRNGVDLVCMSLGSTEPLDFSKIYTEMKPALESNMILSAAAANNGLLTVPACFPNIFGVYVDRSGLLKRHMFGYTRSPIDGVSWCYSKNIPAIRLENSCCSYANAAFAGELYRLMRVGIRKKSELKRNMCKKAVELPFRHRIKTPASYEEVVFIQVDNTQLAMIRKAKDMLTANGYVCALICEKGCNLPHKFHFVLKNTAFTLETLLDLTAMAQLQILFLCLPENSLMQYSNLDLRGRKLTAKNTVQIILETFT